MLYLFVALTCLLTYTSYFRPEHTGTWAYHTPHQAPSNNSNNTPHTSNTAAAQQRHHYHQGNTATPNRYGNEPGGYIFRDRGNTTPPPGSTQGGHFQSGGNGFQYSSTPATERYYPSEDINSEEYSTHFSNGINEQGQGNLETETAADLERERNAFDAAYAANSYGIDRSSTMHTWYTVPDYVDTSRGDSGGSGLGAPYGAAAGTTDAYAAQYGAYHHGSGDQQDSHASADPPAGEYNGNLKTPY